MTMSITGHRPIWRGRRGREKVEFNATATTRQQKSFGVLSGGDDCCWCSSTWVAMSVALAARRWRLLCGDHHVEPSVRLDRGRWSPVSRRCRPTRCLLLPHVNLRVDLAFIGLIVEPTQTSPCMTDDVTADGKNTSATDERHLVRTTPPTSHNHDSFSNTVLPPEFSTASDSLGAATIDGNATFP